MVAPFDEKDHGDQLERWVSFIEHGALAVLLQVPDDADAYKMFETLNDRGLRTSQADLIKNFLFGDPASGSRSPVPWSYMRGALEALDEDDITINSFATRSCSSAATSAPPMSTSGAGLARPSRPRHLRRPP